MTHPVTFIVQTIGGSISPELWGKLYASGEKSITVRFENGVRIKLSNLWREGEPEARIKSRECLITAAMDV